MKIQILLLIIFLSMLLSSCATGYKSIKPPERVYVIKNENDGIVLNYQTDVLSKKYRKKEIKSGTSLVAVKIFNKSGKDLRLGENLQIYLGENQIEPLQLDQIYAIDKQKVLYHLFYLLLTPGNLNRTSSSTTTEGNVVTSSSSSSKNIFPIGLILGPGLFLTNFIIGSSANHKFKEELNQYNLIGKTIPRDSTVYGLIGIKQPLNQTLTVKITP